MQYLPILAGIASASVRRNAATLQLALKYTLTKHFNNNLIRQKTRPRLKSRRPFAQSAIELMESFAGHESIAQWTPHQWLEEWKKSGVPPYSIPSPKVGNPDLGLSRSTCCKLNHHRMRAGCFPGITMPMEDGTGTLVSTRFWRSSNRGIYHTVSGRRDSFRMPGANTDLASPLPALCAWLEENDLTI